MKKRYISKDIISKKQVVNFAKKHTSARLRASTLIEVIIAMVVLMIIFGIALQIILNVDGFTGNRERMKAYLLINSLHEQTIAEQNFVDSEIETGHIILTKEINNYPNSSNILQIEYIATNKQTGFILYKKKVVIKAE